MKKITLILFIIIAARSYSQVTYFNYLDYTSEWRSYGGGWNGVNAYDMYETRYFDGDETINGVVYYKEYSKAVLTSYNPPFGSTYSTDYFGGPYYVREDASGKFYRINPDNGTETVFLDSQEISNAQIGDPFPYAGATCNVETIETVNLGATALKKIKGVNTGNRTGTVEGIGVLGLACATSIESNGGLNCYTRQGITLQFGTVDCNAFPVPQRVNLSAGHLAANKISVYPNPTNGSLSIRCDAQGTVRYEIYTIQGAILKKGTVQNEAQIDISDFSAGVYMMKIGSENSAGFRKIIKE